MDDPDKDRYFFISMSAILGRSGAGLTTLVTNRVMPVDVPNDTREVSGGFRASGTVRLTPNREEVAGSIRPGVETGSAMVQGWGWIGSTQYTSSGGSAGAMSRFTTTGSWPLRTSTQLRISSLRALISWCGT